MAIPCAGYPSRADAWRALAAAGLGEREIAARMEMSVGRVRQVARQAAAKSRLRGRATPPSRTVRIGERTYRRLVALAAEHGVRPRHVAARLLDALGEEREIARNLLGDDG